MRYECRCRVTSVTITNVSNLCRGESRVGVSNSTAGKTRKKGAICVTNTGNKNTVTQLNAQLLLLENT